MDVRKSVFEKQRCVLNQHQAIRSKMNEYSDQKNNNNNNNSTDNGGEGRRDRDGDGDVNGVTKEERTDFLFCYNICSKQMLRNSTALCSRY